MQGVSAEYLAQEAEIGSRASARSPVLGMLYSERVLVKWAVASVNFLDPGKTVLRGLVFCAAFTLSGMSASAQQQAPPQQQPAHQQQYSEFPAGTGRDTFLRVCSKCHSPDNVLASGQDRQGWQNTISKMADLGADATDDEFTAVLDYLAKNFPAADKTNVNKATAAQLETGLALSAKDADAIVQYRAKNGDFKSIDDLKKVPGVDTAKLDAKKNQLAF